MNVPRVCLTPFRNGRSLASGLLAATLLTLLSSAALAQTTNRLAAPLAAGPSQGHTPRAVMSGQATLTQAYDQGRMLRLTFALTPPHLDQERQLIDELHNKKSPEFHKFLTADQWNSRFAPSTDDEEAVVNWAQSQGFTVTHRYASRLLVDVEAPVNTIEKALNIKINNYQMAGKTYFANDHDPELPGSLTHVIQSVMGLDSFLQMRPANVGAKVPLGPRPDYIAGPVVGTPQSNHSDGSTEKLAEAMKQSRIKLAKQQAPGAQITNGAYDPSDIYSSQAYNLSGLQELGHCCNPTNNSGSSTPTSSIAIGSFGDVNFADVAGFHAQYPYIAYNLTKVPVDGGYTCASGGDGNCLEVTMDTEWSTAMANSFGGYGNTAHVFIYEAANFYDMADLYNQMLEDGNARVTSLSWGCEENACFDGSSMNSMDNIFTAMVGQGWTLLAASGDNGATAGCGDGDAVLYPAVDPNFVAAGGTDLSLNGDSTFSSEVAWTGLYVQWRLQ